MNWNSDQYGQLTRTVETHGDGGAAGKYSIFIAKRPSYCDRGDWLIHVEQTGSPAACSLDVADGFPRYFFGSEEDAIRQMDKWISRRKECAEGVK